MDRLRVVTFSKGGRPITRLDINDGTLYTLVRDTIKFDAPERQQQWSDSGNRYGGSILTRESHKNAQLSAEWYVSGSGVADTALQRLEALMIELESLEDKRYIEWRPEGSTRSTYFPIRAPSAWEFMYRWVEFQSTRTLHLKAGWSVAPLGEGERMEISDPFDVNSTADYTAMTGTGVTYNAGGWLETASTAEQQWQHTARGYKYSDAETILKFTTGGTIGAGSISVTGVQIDTNNYLLADINGTSLQIFKKDAGSFTSLGSTAISALSTSTTYYLALRHEGNLVTAELWTTPPTLTGTPTNTAAVTLAGGDATKFGTGTVGGGSGFRFILGAPSGWKIASLTVWPYTYSMTTPSVVAATGSIPGDAPALVSATVAQSGLISPFALLGWTKTPGAPIGGTAAPFGIFEGEAATLTTWASTADAAYRGGTGAKATTAGAGSASALFPLDPSIMQADDLGRGQVDIEIWARVQIASTVVSPVIIASVEPTVGTAFGPSRYTQEWSATGKLLVKPSSGTPLRIVRLGTVTMDVATKEAVAWNLRLAATWGAASTGVFGLDYVILVPALTRAASPTGKQNDTTYPKFISTTSAILRRICPDLSTQTATPGAGFYPDAALAGSPLQFAPGPFSVLLKTSDIVPDDPTSNSLGESTTSTAAKIQLSPVPRYFLPRGT